MSVTVSTESASFRSLPAAPYLNFDSSEALTGFQWGRSPFMPLPLQLSSSTNGFDTNYQLVANVIPKGRGGVGSVDLTHDMFVFAERGSTNQLPRLLSLSSMNLMLWQLRDEYRTPSDVMSKFVPYGTIAARTPDPARMDPYETATTFAVNVGGNLDVHHVWHHQKDQELCPDVDGPNYYVGFILQYIDSTPSLYDIALASMPSLPPPDDFSLLYKVGSKRSASAVVSAVSGPAPSSSSGRTFVSMGTGVTSSSSSSSKRLKISESSDRKLEGECLQWVPYASLDSVIPDYIRRYDCAHKCEMPCYYLGRSVDHRRDPAYADQQGAKVRGYVFPRSPTDHIPGTNDLPVMKVMSEPKRHGIQWAW